MKCQEITGQCLKNIESKKEMCKIRVYFFPLIFRRPLRKIIPSIESVRVLAKNICIPVIDIGI